MIQALRIDTVRTRLTVFYTGVLAVALVVVGGLIYVLLARALYSRIDANLAAVMDITITSLSNDLAEGQDVVDAARSTAAELSSRQQMLAIYDGGGRPLADGGHDDDLEISLPPLDTIPVDEVLLLTVAETGDEDDRHRLAMRRVTIAPHDATYVVVVGSSMEPTDEELGSLRGILAYVVPIALVLAGIGGWFLVRQGLSPIMAMATRARKLGADDLSGRLPVVNPRDEVGQLAETFNDLLSRLETSLTLQRQFMADASHELRTPVTTARTAATVALQQGHRSEAEYRQSLEIIEQQAARLSRIVDDMFTLARADAGNYPVRAVPMYLDEVVHDVVRAARVIASTQDVSIETRTSGPAAFTGDEDLVRRLIVNLLDNAVRYAPRGTTVRIDLESVAGGYALSITDRGPGIPVEAQPHIFERFYRADTARARSRNADEGAGLGLALARWIAQVHQGGLNLARSSDAGSTFTAFLPYRG